MEKKYRMISFIGGKNQIHRKVFTRMWDKGNREIQAKG
jgi:hypothetical protein